MSEKLKPCPWCEAPAHEQEWTKINGPWECIEVQCDGCERSVRGVDAIAAWNALPRTPQVAPAETIRSAYNEGFWDGHLHGNNDMRETCWEDSDTRAEVFQAAPDKPHYADLAPKPWGGPDGEEDA